MWILIHLRKAKLKKKRKWKQCSKMYSYVVLSWSQLTKTKIVRTIPRTVCCCYLKLGCNNRLAPQKCRFSFWQRTSSFLCNYGVKIHRLKIPTCLTSTLFSRFALFGYYPFPTMKKLLAWKRFYLNKGVIGE